MTALCALAGSCGAAAVDFDGNTGNLQLVRLGDATSHRNKYNIKRRLYEIYLIFDFRLDIIFGVANM
ncbi:hypothetical protein AGMMS49925_04600 [Deltaproteobacteria bacterium]|nr:hypothetical protein AGMMS49925_04600 [Deltaproteobacteria bacterium]